MVGAKFLNVRLPRWKPSEKLVCDWEQANGGRRVNTNTMCSGESIDRLSQLWESPCVVVDDAKLRCFCRRLGWSENLKAHPGILRTPTTNYGDPNLMARETT